VLFSYRPSLQLATCAVGMVPLVLVALVVPSLAACTVVTDGVGIAPSCSEGTTHGGVLIQSSSALEKRALAQDLMLGAAVCDEDAWPDKDHGLVCGECKVLVNRFKDFYKTCNGYCRSVRRQCAGAWEERGDTCDVLRTMRCDESIDSSDAICQCGDELPPDSVGGTCYGELAQLAVTEGGSVGSVVWTNKAAKCQESCNADPNCKSFSLCPQWYSCYMKDRALTGDEPTRQKGSCKTYYKKPCDGGSAPPAPAPVPAPPTGDVPTLKVMSYNTEYKGYPSRVSQYGRKISDVGAAVVGTQECQDMRDLARRSGYQVVPGTDIQNPIFYDPGQVQFVDGSSGWMKIPRDRYAPRTITWAQFRLGSASFWFFNTHLPHRHGEAGSSSTHSEIARSLLRKREQLGAGNSPSVVTGDMNPFASNGARDSFESILVKAGWSKAYQARGNPGYRGLDKIFASSHWRASNGADQGTGSSDHPAIAVDLKLRA